ncbi:MAG TPA: efflux transporter outer membrane subunit [Methylophilaceae bacterium]|nr:efflux transporter outer membrane subunit [Methylophilaceae bacterium]
MKRLNTKVISTLALTLTSALILSACSLAPELKSPEVPVAENYKETAPWMPARPADELSRGPWWKLFGDPQLDQLQEQLITNNPDLAAAVANYKQAQAYSDQLRSGLFPTLTGTGNAQRNRQSDRRPLRSANSDSEYSSYSIGVQADYEIDLWKRVSNQVAAGKASAEAARADLESARLSLQAQLAENYVVLRGLDKQIALLRDTVTANKKSLDLTRARYDGGIAPKLDVARAQTQHDTAQSQVEQALAQRAITEHAIAALVGTSVSQFSIAPTAAEMPVPEVPLGVPSSLLQRRPDIAAAQRRVAADNASIGVARAAFFPSLTLSGIIGFQSDTAGNWIAAPNTFWSIGPSLLMNLFDAGKRKAQVRQAEAALDESGARYRSVVIGAFQQVEDNLALLNHYRAAAESQESASAAAQQSLDFAMSRYKAGAASYLEVATSQALALQTQRDLLDLNTRQLRASVQLIRALGGGWAQPG